MLAIGLAAAQPTMAEIKDEHIVIGPEQVWIEFIDPVEIMWVGPNQYERTQVLSGGDIETVGFVTDPGDAALLGARVIVAELPGTHSCDNLKDALAYYVVTLTPALATDGPFASCGEMTMSLSKGQILLEEDPMREFTEDGGQFMFWVPGKGFTQQAE
jgi:hypothetical protein